MNRRSGYGNKMGNRFNDNNNHGRLSQNNNNNNRGGGGNFGQQMGGWRQQGGGGGNNFNQGRQGGGGMNAMDNHRPFQNQHQNMMSQHQQNQFANQMSQALRNSVGPNPGMMSSFGGGNQDQPVVMVVPQSQATGGMMGGGHMGNMGNMGNMGMMSSQNPFAAAVMNQQKPMQVVVGNMPGLNPAAFGQQVLPAYGQGVGQQNMDMFGHQGQQGSSNRFGRDNKNSSDRGRFNQRNQKITLVRRTEANDRGRMGTPRGVAKKRVIPGRDQYVDAKKPKITGVVARNRIGGGGPGIRKDRPKLRRGNKPGTANNKTEVKKEDGKDKPTTNGEAQETAGDGEAKVADAAEADAEPKPSKYEEIPVELLVCKVCRTTLSDAAAFDSHLAGKSHVTMMKILEEKFTKRAQLLMFESKMCEDEVAVQLDRPRRSGKNQGKASKTHCKMCDCSYTVNWGNHKQSVWHRVLKEFLHPNCRFCKSQFVHRKDWVEHIMSVGHLKKLIELKQEGKISVIDQESTLQEELFAVHIELSKEEKLLNIVNVHSLGGEQPLTDDVKAMLQGENGEIQLPEGEIKIPDAYDENTAYGEDAVFKIDGSCCKVCRTYIAATEEGDHCKTRKHFDAFVDYLKRVVKMREHKAEEERKAQEEAEKKAKSEAEAAAKAAEDAKAAAVAAAAAALTASKANAESPTKKEEPSTAASSESKPENLEVDQATPAADGAVAEEPEAEAAVELDEADVTMEEASSEDKTAQEKASTSPAKANEPAKPAVTPTQNKTPQRGGQNNRGARGSPARGGRGQPNRGGYNRGGRGGQQQTPARGGATPRGNNNVRGARGGARGSPGRGRGRGGW